MELIPENFDINDIDPKNLATWPLVMRIGVIVLICAVLSGGFVWFMLLPSMNEVTRLESQQVKLKKEFESLYAKAASDEAYEVQVKAVKEKLMKLMDLLPNAAEVPKLVEEISHTGIAAGLKFQAIKLQDEEKSAFYAELPMEIRLRGSYHSLSQFISDVVVLPRLVTIGDISFVQRSQNPSGRREEILDLLVQAKTYRYLSPEEQGGDW